MHLRRGYSVGRRFLRNVTLRLASSERVRERIMELSYQRTELLFPGTFVPKSEINGFLLAKDSLIKSSHTSHPIAGRRPGAAGGKRPGQRPGVTARVA